MWLSRGLVHIVSSTFSASSFKSLQSKQNKNGGSEVKSLMGLPVYTHSSVYDGPFCSRKVVFVYKYSM